jgi:hypothetical protein
MSKPESYKVQDGCFNCKHAFMWYDYDSDVQFYCTFDQSAPRPLCGSVALEESFMQHLRNNGIESYYFLDGDKDNKSSDNIGRNPEYEKEWSKLNDAWCAWEPEHSVHESGICDHHENEKVHTK